jgi:predicted ester cyclase
VPTVTSESLAHAYASFSESGDRSLMEMLSPEFHDHVSGRRGPRILDVVLDWLERSFADRRVELHAAMSNGDRVMIWFTMHGTHVGNGFPRLVGRPVRGREVHWSQVHVFRLADGLAVEHWAVRDDAGLLDQIGSDPD